MKNKAYSQGEVDQLLKIVTSDVSEWAKKMIEEIPKHYTTAPATDSKINELHTAIKNLGCRDNAQKINRLEEAIYGDKNDGTNVGIKMQLDDIKHQLDEIKNFFSATKGASKTIVWVFGAISIFTAGTMALKQLIKSLAQ